MYLIDKTRNPGRNYDSPVEFGVIPPKLVSYGDLCPTVNCPSSNCSEQCKESMVNLFDLVNHFEMKPFPGRYPGLPNRTLGKCAVQQQ